MPPKRKLPKTEGNTEVVEETSNEIPLKKKVSKTVVKTSPRTLRPRTKIEPAVQAKTKSVKATKKEAKVVKSTAKSQKAAKSEKGEPAKKLSNLDEIEKEDDEVISATSIYNFTANNINGQVISLNKYKNHVCIIVNVASKCGHTSSNYKEFVDIYDKYSEDKGLRILAFPCNQFGKQEPGDNEKICEFAKKRNVNFDMFEKIEVNGKNAHPLWKYLTSQIQGPKGNKIDWNFTKFLINKDGQVVERFKPSVKPSALVKDLEKLW